MKCNNICEQYNVTNFTKCCFLLFKLFYIINIDYSSNSFLISYQKISSKNVVFTESITFCKKCYVGEFKL